MYTLEMARAHMQELHAIAERSRATQPSNTLKRVKRLVGRRKSGR
ncbi:MULTISPECIES: hypothetical protein [Embleya]|nr:hypothetical protein [Embleya scabrispora]